MSLLELDGIGKTLRRHGHERVMLRDVSLAVDAGESLAILGDAGSGKSMLLQIAAGITRPDAGVVRFAGQDLYALTTDQRHDLHRSEIGWTHHMSPVAGFDTVLGMTMLGRADAVGFRTAEAEARDLLDEIGIGALAPVAWGELVGDEQRLVSLASVLLRRPRLLLADDPLLGQDVVRREQLMALLRSRVEQDGMTLVLATTEIPLSGWDRLAALSVGGLIHARPRSPAEVIELPRRRDRSA
jgi:predicted ABC-type transport system involved in lysophospholipase L1 biosynthesis ATPase subunit